MASGEPCVIARYATHVKDRAPVLSNAAQIQVVQIQVVEIQVVEIQVVEIQGVEIHCRWSTFRGSTFRWSTFRWSRSRWSRYGNSAFLDLDHLSLGISVVVWELV